MAGIKSNIERLFYLEDHRDKIKLIELLLIIGSLIAAFKISGSFGLVFILFVFFSIPYFIMIQKEECKEKISKDYKLLVNVFSVIIAATFSAILSTLLALSAVNEFTRYCHENGFIHCYIYHLHGVINFNYIYGIKSEMKLNTCYRKPAPNRSPASAYSCLAVLVSPWPAAVLGDSTGWLDHFKPGLVASIITAVRNL